MIRFYYANFIYFIFNNILIKDINEPIYSYFKHCFIINSYYEEELSNLNYFKYQILNYSITIKL